MQRLRSMRPGETLLGSGLVIELATILGAECAGIDASPRLIRAQDRSPDSDIRVGTHQGVTWRLGASTVFQNVGEEAFLAAAEREASEWIRNGLPLRAESRVVASVGHRPSSH